MKKTVRLLLTLSILSLPLVGCADKEQIQTHIVTFDTHGGSLVSSQTIRHGEKITKPDDPTKAGCRFINWTYLDEEWSFVGYTVTSDMTLDANWHIIEYVVNYDLNGGTLSALNPFLYTIEDNIVLNNPTKTGYTFAGWYDQNDNLITTLGQTIIGDLYLTATWDACLYTLSVTSDDPAKGTVAIKQGSGYSDEQIIVEATPNDDCLFAGWYKESYKISNQETYQFKMPKHDYSLVAHFISIEEEIELGKIPYFDSENNVVTYGLYPQSKVSDASIISSLVELESPETNGWYLYDKVYYAKLSATPNKYNSNIKFNDGTSIVEGTTYWFKCEPIEWKILIDNYLDAINKNVGYYLLSSKVLDVSVFKNYNDYRTVYNNYESSDIHIYLNNTNGGFYDLAFGLDDSYLNDIVIANDSSTTDWEYNYTDISGPVKTKVFLPSFKDYTNPDLGFSSKEDRLCLPSDWALAKGCQVDNEIYAAYWTRSFYSQFSYMAWAICASSEVIDGLCTAEVKVTAGGVRPAIALKSQQQDLEI